MRRLAKRAAKARNKRPRRPGWWGADFEEVQLGRPRPAFSGLRNHWVSLPRGETSLQAHNYREVRDLGDRSDGKK